jgi:enoyl-CoA hydratase/carnithine racemase
MVPLSVDVHPPLAWVILDRPDEGNPIDETLIDALRESWATIGHDSAIRAIGIGATGPAFSIGAPSGSLDERPFGPKSCGCTVPVLVELRGDVGSAAFQLLGEADVVLATPDVRFTVSLDLASRLEVLRFDSYRWQAVLRRFALLGPYEPLTAEKASQAGIVSELVSPGGLRWRSEEVLRALAVQERER